MWWIYALLSAVFAALTAIFAKIGIKGVDSDVATAIRTVIILILAWGIVLFKGSTSTIGSLTKVNWIFLILSGCATGPVMDLLFQSPATWKSLTGCTCRQTERSYRYCAFCHFPGRTAYLEERVGRTINYRRDICSHILITF